MNNGVDSKKRECENESEKAARRRAHPDDYGRSVSKIAVAQVCEGVGFDRVKESALEVLSSIALRFMRDLGKSANSYASLAGRSECNVFDIVMGLEDFGSSSGFPGSSEVKQGVVGSGVIKEISQFVGTVEDIPFVQPIPRFPVTKVPRLIPSFSEMGESSSKHIPDWLPAFPDPHTYLHTPVWNQRKTDLRIDKGEQSRQRRKAERSLLNLQQRLLSSGLVESSGSGYCPVDNGRETEGGAFIEEGSYLSPPLPAGEKEVSVAALPLKFGRQGDKKHPSVREAFAPVIDALKGGALDPMDVDRRVVLDRRPVVHFKLKAGKKMLVEDLDVHLRSGLNGRRGSWLPRDDDKDDRKKRAEQILRQSMEYNQEQHSQM